MHIIISNSSNVPIYEQIKEAIIQQILDNVLSEDEMLPSIRVLAQNIKISVMTVKKAYDELEQEGYIITRQGKGSFVAPQNFELVREKMQQEMEAHLTAAIALSHKCVLSKADFLDFVSYLYEEESNE